MFAPGQSASVSTQPAQRPAIDRCVISTAKPRLRSSDETRAAASTSGISHVVAHETQ